MRLLLAFALVAVALSYPQQKAKVVSNNEISALSDKSDTANAKVVNEGNVKVDYKGKGGVINDKAGTGEATQQGKGDSFNAKGPDGKVAKGTVDKAKKTVNVVDAAGNKVDADVTDPKLINAKVNGKDQYKVVRDDNGNADVFPKNSNNVAHKVSNLKEGTDNVVINTPNKAQRVEKLVANKDAQGKLTQTQTSDAENQIPGIPIGNKNSAKMQYKGSSDTDLQVGKSFGATNNDALSVGAAGEVSSDAVDTKPCYTGASGKDALEEKNGIKVDSKSIKFELIKDADGQYAFPSCFNAFADVFVPAGIKIEDLSASSQITSPVAGGDMQCDPKVTCLDKATANRPVGSCFFCDFCNKNQPQGAFGVGTEANICDAKAGQTLPLKWKLCPPEGSAGKFIPFIPSGQKQSGDIVAVLRLFLRSSAKKWEEVACKQSIYSFKVGLANGNPIGSKKTNTQLSKSEPSKSASSFGDIFG